MLKWRLRLWGLRLLWTSALVFYFPYLTVEVSKVPWVRGLWSLSFGWQAQARWLESILALLVVLPGLIMYVLSIVAVSAWVWLFWSLSAEEYRNLVSSRC